MGRLPLQKELEKRWRKPVRVANDAAVQGYGSVSGKGVELTLTLGTGMGSALFTDGHLCPGLELGHHPWNPKPTRTTSAAAVSTSSAKKPGTASSSTPSLKPPPPSTGTTSTSAAAIPKKSPSPRTQHKNRLQPRRHPRRRSPLARLEISIPRKRHSLDHQRPDMSIHSVRFSDGLYVHRPHPPAP